MKLYLKAIKKLNEYSYNRESNTTKHGSVTKEYAPMDESNSYVMSPSSQPWYSETSSIKSVEIGSKMKPTSTAYWFYNLTNIGIRTYDENYNRE